MRLDFHENHRLLFGVVLGGFVVLCLAIAIGPALWVNGHNEPLPGSPAPTADELSGLKLYVSEGCPYCHSQQVRPLPEDRPFGRPSVPGDYARLAWLDVWREPAGVLGSERTGPDLSDVADREPNATWQYIHLYQPRAVVPWSVMAAFPWLFRVERDPPADAVVVPVPPPYAPSVGKVVATPRAEALVAYVLSLKQPPLPAGGRPPAVSEGAGAAGPSLYASRCATCHQTNGRGLPAAFPSLVADPTVTASDGATHIRVVLFGRQGGTIDGVAYASAMPAWGQQLSDGEIAAVINYERTSWGNRAPPVTEADVAAVRRAGPGSAPAP